MNKSWKDSKGNLHEGKALVSKNGFTVIDCHFCEFKHIIPLTDESIQKEFYSEKFYEEEKQNYIQRQQEDYDWWSIEYNEKYDLFEKYFDKSGQRKMLDIGSGPGFFLKIGKERGWDVTGIEPGKPAYEFSTSELGLNVINEFFCKENYFKFGTFDIIHLNNVLEHIVDPINMVKMAKEILNPNGQVCITCPNDFNPLQLMAVENLNKDYWWVVPEHHINYFDLKSLKKLLIKIGLDVIYHTVSFPLELYLLMGDDYIGNDDIGRKIHGKRMTLEKHFNKAEKNQLKRDIYGKLAEIGLGRELTVIAQ